MTAGFAAKASPPASGDRIIYWDTAQPGFGLVVTRNRARSWVVQYRAQHRSRRITIDGRLGFDAARRQARKLQGEVAKGQDPLIERRRKEREPKNTLEAVCRNYLDRQDGKLRSLNQTRAVLQRRIFGTELGAKQIGEIRRSDIVRLLDAIEKREGRRGGPCAADRCLAAIRRVMRWHGKRADDFIPPIMPERRANSKDRARDRILSDDELRAIWRAAEASTGPIGPLVKLLLLTGARRREASGMRWSELSGSDWTIPAEAVGRNKTKRDLLRPLSNTALAALSKIPRINGCDFVFTHGGKRAFTGFDAWKQRLHKASGTTGWVLHDLRRTARSLMSRVGVPSDHAERCLGHVIGGVRGIYDRHAYHKEKKLAYEALAAQIDRIVNPQPNVVPMRSTELPA